MVDSPRIADWTSYGTCVNPQDFVVDWAGFYRRGRDEAEQLRAEFEHRADVGYGEDGAQLLDIFFPPEPAPGRPVILFLHGGGFTEGHPLLYDWLGRPYLERGIAFISAGYRLAPAVTYPDTADDLALAVQWVYRNLADRCAVDRLHVAGHSAGAMIAAQLAYRDDWQGEYSLPTTIIDSVTLISGIYDWRIDWPGNHVPPARRAEASPVCNLTRFPRHTIVAFGPQETNRRNGSSDIMRHHGQVLHAAIAAGGGSAETVPIEGADHGGTAEAFADRSGPLFAAVLRTVTSA